MEQKHNELDFRRLMRAVKNNWWLYLLSLILLMGMAVTYVSFRMPEYTSRATMIIESGSEENVMAAAQSSAAVRMLAGGSATVANEIYVISSNDVLSRTVRQCGLNTVYIRRDGLEKTLLFPLSKSPLRAALPQQTLDTMMNGFKIKVHLHDGKADIDAVTGFMGLKKLASVKGVKLPYTLKNKICNVDILPTAAYSDGLDTRIDINISGTPLAALALADKLSIGQDDKASDAISLTIDDPDRARGRMILNQLMEQYNSKRLERRRETAATEVNYCNNRLSSLLGQLSESENKVEQFKRDNNLNALALDSAGWIGRTAAARDRVEQMQNEYTYYDQVLFSLNNDPNGESFIPGSAGMTPNNPIIEEYNKLISQKRELERSATDENPTLKTLNEQIARMRSSIISDFSKTVELSRRNLGSLYSLSTEAKAKVREMPGLERELFDLLRDKTFKNEMYIYLLQRREAAELKLTATDTMGFVADKAWSDKKPSPVKSYVAVLLAILMSIICPTLLILFELRRRDAVSRPIDLAFINLEENTVCATADNAGMRLLRSKIINCKQCDTILVADATDTDVTAQIASSFANIETDAAVIDIPADNSEANDALLAESFSRNAAELLKGNRYVLVNVPDISKLNEIITLVDKENVLLVLAVQTGKIRRRHIRKLLKGQDARHVMVYILPKNK